MAYKGKFKPKNTEKYKGDPTNVVYRSIWERNTFRWLDENPSITLWSSEEFFIPYRCSTDNKMHRYFVDLWYRTNIDEEFIIEIKPKHQTTPPKRPVRQNRKYINESMTYIKNISKWAAAEQYAQNRGWTFAIWTEDTLKSLGIKILK
jgi:hypothetical protein